MLTTLAALAAIVVASCCLGQAVLRLCGAAAWAWASPLVGLAALVILAPALIRLPGHGATCAVVLGIAVVAAAVWCRAALRLPATSAEVLGVAGLILLAVLVPFVVNGRFGTLGVSFNNDTRLHLWAIEQLRTTGSAPVFASGYPLGPHALAAAVEAVLGGGADKSLNGLLMAVPVLTGLTALGFSRRLALWRRGLIALLPALAYLPAAYYAQSAFKETMLAAFLVAVALVLHDLMGRAPDRRAVLPLSVLAAGCVYTYSYPGLVWPVGTVVVCVAAQAVAAGLLRRPADGLAAARALVPAALAGGVAFVVLLVPEIPKLLDFFDTLSLSPSGSGVITESNTGNLVQALSPLEAFGTWPAPDFRLAAGGIRQIAVLAPVGALAAAYGLVWSLRRRDFALPAAVFVSALAYLRLRGGESIYLSAKTLVILSPVAVLMGARAVLAPTGMRMPALGGAKLAAAAVLVAAMAWSTALALRDARVDPGTHERELVGLRPLLRGSTVLFLGFDDYIGWRLFGSTVTDPPVTAPVPFALRPQKPFKEGDPMDFDSVDSATLDRFRYVITTRTPYASVPPPNFRRVRATPSYVVWERHGPTPTHRVLAEGAAPGRVLDCTTRAGRRISRSGGTAVVRPRPLVFAPPGAVSPGVTLPPAQPRLRAGRYRLSVSYESAQRVELRGPGYRAVLPAHLDRPGPFWPAGTLVVRRSGLVPIAFSVPDRSPLRPRSHIAAFGAVAVTRADVPQVQRIPLREACGRYVDWYVPAR